MAGDLLSLAVFVGACVAAAGSAQRYRPGTWYQNLDKPGWTPSGLVFPVVWAVLYTLIALSGWQVWRAAGWAAWPELALYALNLLINAAWSMVFFGWRRMDLGLVVMAALWLSIAALIAAFAAVDTLASGLLVPYLLWVSIAAVLNWSIWRRNPAQAQTAR
jgi:tryptophan-rich sensory protein